MSVNKCNALNIQLDSRNIHRYEKELNICWISATPDFYEPQLSACSPPDQHFERKFDISRT